MDLKAFFIIISITKGTENPKRGRDHLKGPIKQISSWERSHIKPRQAVISARPGFVALEKTLGIFFLKPQKNIMAVNWISNTLGIESHINYVIQNRLGQYISSLKKDLLGPGDRRSRLLDDYIETLVSEEMSVLANLVANEIFFDLVISYKTNDPTYYGRKDLERLITLTFIKYSHVISTKIFDFNQNLSKLKTKLKKEKWKIKKIRRVPKSITEPINVSLDIRFAIIKKAKGKCENCRSSIDDRPIDVYQLQKDDKICLVAFCNNCFTKNRDNVVETCNGDDNSG